MVAPIFAAAFLTISVREAARIQTFPDNYVFDTPYMEYACGMIGNALPCDFAETLAESVAKQLRARARA
jgi:DNA (cytosine-5)-methyltransferase 1